MNITFKSLRILSMASLMAKMVSLTCLVKAGKSRSSLTFKAMEFDSIVVHSGVFSFGDVVTVLLKGSSV